MLYFEEEATLEPSSDMPEFGVSSGYQLFVWFFFSCQVVWAELPASEWVKHLAPVIQKQRLWSTERH